MVSSRSEPNCWTVPGGGRDPDEDGRCTSVREAKEEVRRGEGEGGGGGREGREGRGEGGEGEREGKREGGGEWGREGK